MSKYSLIAFDMDGTLLDSQKHIRQDSIKAISDAGAAGKVIALSTGRSMPELADFSRELAGVDYFMCTSGAYIYDNRNSRIICRFSLPDDTVLALFERVRDEDVMIHIHSDEVIAQKDRQSHMADYHMGGYQQMFDRLVVKPENLENYYIANRFPVYKFNLYCRSGEQRRRVLDLLEGLPVSIALAEQTSVECSPPGISKASGLQRLCEYLSIPMESSIAVGDSDNDLEILKAAGLAVAMGNARESAAALADVIVSSNDEGGCAETIYKYLL